METTQQLYWITQLDSIRMTLLLVAIAGIITAVVFACVAAEYKCLKDADDRRDSSKYKYNAYWADKGRRATYWSAPIGFAAMIILTFTPTTEQAYIIYGVGDTIDYLKQNEAAQQLPDKAIKALDSWVEYVTVEPADSTKNNNR